MPRARIVLLVLLFCSLTGGHVPISNAGESGALQLALGLSAMDFNYAEYDQDRTLDKEDGVLPGVHLALNEDRGSWRGNLEVSFHGGEVDYVDLTNPGNPIDSRTQEAIFDASFRLRYEVGADKGAVSGGVFAGGGYRRWDRDIASTSATTGLDETYRWPYLLGGIHVQARLSAVDRLGVDVEWLRPVRPRLGVDFKNRYDNIELEPGSDNGFRLRLRWQRPIIHDFHVISELGYERWRLGASDAEPLFKNGQIQPGATVLEPEGETEQISFTLYLQRLI